MPQPASAKGLSLKWLEVFQACAQHGSLKETAAETGLAISTVSQHLRSLEDHLGIPLFDHQRRPLVLTPQGQLYLRNIDVALHAIRKARTVATAGDLGRTTQLRLGVIEDLESDVTPDLAVYLSGKMPDCAFQYHTASSHQITRMLRDRRLDLGVAIMPPDRTGDMDELPILRDPFIMVLPKDAAQSSQDIIAGQTKLPFLQFSSELIIARQIEAQLRRMSVALPHKFECGSNQTLMAMVAAGAGWTITTPLLLSRAKRFHAQLAVRPFPGKRFARTLSLIVTPDCPRDVQDLVDQHLRASLNNHVLQPVLHDLPWLEDQFALIS